MTTMTFPITDAAAGSRPWRIEGVWESDAAGPVGAIRGGELPQPLRRRFDAHLEIPLRPDRPTVVANFVSTIDGVVALDSDGRSGGGEISGGFEPDRFLMGLLRATADAVLVGAGTVRASRSQSWTPGRVHPASAAGYLAWRRQLGLVQPVPTTVIVSASGDLRVHQLGNAEPDAPIVVVTTQDGARRLRGFRPGARIEVVRIDEPRVSIQTLLGLMAERGFRLVVSEAGPTLFGQLLAARTVDELFVTVAPQMVGRSDQVNRLGLVEGVGFPPGVAPWASLRTVMRSEDHLFLRYRLTDPKGLS
jgi:riboflavin biosynthesis pyrimidine reductase